MFKFVILKFWRILPQNLQIGQNYTRKTHFSKISHILLSKWKFALRKTTDPNIVRNSLIPDETLLCMQ
jgi:hypothetical protein